MKLKPETKNHLPFKSTEGAGRLPKSPPDFYKYSSLISDLSAQLFTFDIWTVIALSIVEVWSGLGNKATWFGLGKDHSLG